jgi:hypothetical protein
MNWKKTLFVAILAGAVLSAMEGCSQAKETVPATEPTPSATQQAPSTTRQTPPNASFNGTRPLPPSGNFTGERPAAPTMDLAAAAAKLGITETQLSEALGNTQQGFTDLLAAATKLGVSEDALRQALSFSNNGTMPSGPPPAGSFPSSQGQ